jgi:hypothetical protein
MFIAPASFFILYFLFYIFFKKKIASIITMDKKTIIDKICIKWFDLCPSDLKIPSIFFVYFKNYIISKKFSRTELVHTFKLSSSYFIEYIVELTESDNIIDKKYTYIFKKYMTNLRILKSEELANIARLIKIKNLRISIESSSDSSSYSSSSSDSSPVLNIKKSPLNNSSFNSDSSSDSDSSSELNMEKSSPNITGTLEDINNAEAFTELWNAHGFPKINSAYIIDNCFPSQLIKKWMTITDGTIHEMAGVWSFIEKEIFIFNYNFDQDSDGFILLSEYEDIDLDLDD